MITVVEISECFPNKNKPVTGEFILQHVKALSEHCRVITIVPLRMFPPRELLNMNPVTLISNLGKWYHDISDTNNYSQGNLDVLYFSYFSLPRPYFEILDAKILQTFYFNKLRKVLEKYKPDLIYCNWLRPWAEVSGKLAVSFNVPFIIDHHEDLPTLKNLFPSGYNNFIKIFEKAESIIVHSNYNKTDLEKENLKLGEVKVIYLGQNFQVSEDSKKFNVSKTKLVCVSHLNEPRKNIDVLIKAFSLLKDNNYISLTIVGDGMLKQKYIELAESLNLSGKIKFTGSKSQKDVETILEESEMFVLPSFPEAFGVVFIEALAKGLPVITCKGNGGGEELLKLGYQVVLTEPESAKDLSEAISNLSDDIVRKNQMSESGKTILKSNFSWEKNAEATYEFIEKTIREFKLKDYVRN